MNRPLLLLRQSIYGGMHRATHDLAREIVVGICSLIVFMLFFYIFNDFLNVEVKSISVKMRDSFALWGGAILCTLAAGFAGRQVRRESQDSRSYLASARFMGESSGNLQTFWNMRRACILGAYYLPALFVTHRYLVKLHSLSIFALVGSLFILLFISYITASIGAQQNESAGGSKVKAGQPLLLSGRISPITALVDWRYRLLIERNRIARLCLVLAGIFSVLTGFVCYRQGADFVGILSSFISGILVASALVFQLADDLPSSWVEKSSGVSHDLYVLSLSRVAWKLGLSFGIFNGLVWVCTALVSRGAVEMSLLDFDLAGKVLFMVLTPVLILPYLAFQIDARKPSIQITVVFLIGLFVCTAIYAHWLGLLLILLLKHYGGQTQQGYFYRA